MSQLESELVKGGFKSCMPVYLVIDASVYCEHLQTVTELSACKKFIIVVPKIGTHFP